MPLNGKQAELLAYWYFRLNGYFTIKDFIVHPDLVTGQQTDIDIFGVRFPHRSELLENPMLDDKGLIENEKIQIIMVEVKVGNCNLNFAWRNKELKNIERFLQAIGVFPLTKIEAAANSIYKEALYEDDNYVIQIVAVGSEWNSKLVEELKEIDQITHEHMLVFIYNRFEKYHLQKKLHDQWDDFGKELWNNYYSSGNEDEFIRKYIT